MNHSKNFPYKFDINLYFIITRLSEFQVIFKFKVQSGLGQARRSKDALIGAYKQFYRDSLLSSRYAYRILNFLSSSLAWLTPDDLAGAKSNDLDRSNHN